MKTSRFNAYCNARIYAASGAGPIYTFSLIPSGEAKEVHCPFLTGASIVANFDVATQVTINFDAPFDEGLKLLESDVFAPNGVLEVEMGYIGSEEQSGLVFGLIIQAQQGITITPEGVNGTVTANIGPDVPALYKEAWGVSSFIENVSGVIEQKAKEAGYSEVIFGGSSREMIDLSGIWANGLSQSLHQMLAKLRSFARCVWSAQVVKGKYVLEIKTIKESSAEEATRVFIMRGGLLNKHSVFGAYVDMPAYPIISLNPEIMGFSFGTRPVKVRSADVGRDGEVFDLTEDAEISEEKSGATKAENVAPTKAKTKDQEVSKEPAEKQATTVAEVLDPEAEAEKSRQRLANINSGFQTLKVSLTTIGIPSIGKQETVAVLGTGRFDGAYMVKQATHVWSGSAIDTTLELYWRGIESSAGLNEKAILPDFEIV